MFSYVDIDNIPLQPNLDQAMNSATTVTATLRYSPWDDLWLALEYFYGQRGNFDGETGHNNRLNLIFRYIVNG